MQGRSKPIKWVWVLLVLLTLLLPFLYVKSQLLDLDSHARTLQYLAKLKELDVSINDKLYEVYFGLNPMLDDLVTAQDNLIRESREFVTGLPEELSRSVDGPWDEYQLLLKRKLELVEGFKSQNAVLRNSLRYFPVLSEEFNTSSQRTHGPADLSKLVDDLRHEMLLSGIDQGYEHDEKLILLLQQLEARLAHTPAVLRELYEGVLIHANTIVRARRDISDRLKQIRSIGTRETLNDVNTAYMSAFESWKKETDTYFALTYGVASLLIGLIIFVLYRLRQATVRQGKLLNELNFQKFALDQHAIVSITDVRGDITYVNDKFCEISQFNKDELIGKNHRIVKSDEHSSDFFKQMWRTIARGDVWHGVIKNFARDGSVYWVSSTIVPFLNERGKPYRYVSIRTDITPQITAEEDLKKAHEDLEHRVEDRTRELSEEIAVRKEAEKNAESANRIKSEFLANMSHELRTPMNGIIGLSLLALKTKLDDQQRDYILKVHQSANSLLSILNDILDFSKIEAGKVALENIPFDLHGIIDNLQDLLLSRIEEKAIRFEAHIAPDVPHYLVGDPLRLRQILINLVGNAIKFSHYGGAVELSISSQILENESYRLRFTIRDEGIGISIEQQNTLFKPFEQADTSTTRKYGGTGLGLVISRELVEMMHGTIELESEEHAGSTFSFTAVFHGTPSDFEIPPVEDNTSNDRVRKAESQLRNCKLLLVEDNPVNQEVAVEFLRGYGMDVTTVNNGQEALDILAVQKFDAVLMDCQMPVMDGYDATRHIRNHRRFDDLPVIAMTAHTMRGDREKSLSAGMNDYISKPFEPDSMLLTLARWVKPNSNIG